MAPLLLVLVLAPVSVLVPRSPELSISPTPNTNSVITAKPRTVDLANPNVVNNDNTNPINSFNAVFNSYASPAKAKQDLDKGVVKLIMDMILVVL